MAEKLTGQLLCVTNTYLGMTLTLALSPSFDVFNNRNCPFSLCAPSVFQTLQTTDPGAEREPPENHAKVR